MQPTTQNKEAPHDVPKQISEAFLEALSKKSEIPAEVVTSLRKILIDEENLSEKALRVALFGEGE